MTKYALALGVAMAMAACSSNDGGGGGTAGTGGAGGAAGSGGSGGVGGGITVEPSAPLAMNCALFGNDARFPLESSVTISEEPQIGQPLDATVRVSMVLPVEVVCGIEDAGFMSVDIESASTTVTITGVSDPDPGEVTVILPGTPITDITFADACDDGNGPGLVFAFDPQTISITPNGASTMDFLLTVEGVDLNLANLMGAGTLPMLNIPAACNAETVNIGADPDGDGVFNILATPEFQIQIPVLCEGQSCDDDIECTADACVEGTCESSNVPDETPCNGGLGACVAGTCEALLCRDVDCSDGKTCTVDPTCNPENGECEGGGNEPEGTLCNQDGGQVCDGLGDCVGCNTSADCTEGETECKESVCDNDTSMCLPAANRPDGANCTQVGGAAGQCNAGDCVSFCFDAGTRCNVDQCLDTDCDPSDGQCINTPLTGQPCDLNGSSGICSAAGVCESAALCEDAATRCTANENNECVNDTCDPSTGDCGSSNVANDTSCDSGQGTCQDGVCEQIPLTCGTPDNGVAEPCLSASVLADDCFLVTGSVPIPATPVIIPTTPWFDGMPATLFPSAQAVLPNALLCFLDVAASGGADLKDSALEVVRASGATADFLTRSYVDPTDPGPAGTAPQSPHGLVRLDFTTLCTAGVDLQINFFPNNSTGVCNIGSLPGGAGTCQDPDDATNPNIGATCVSDTDCLTTAVLDLTMTDLGLGAAQAQIITPAAPLERFGFTHVDLSIDIGDVIPGTLDNVCIGGACPTLGRPVPVAPGFFVAATDGCAPVDRDGDGCPGDPTCGPCISGTCGGLTGSTAISCTTDADCGAVPTANDSPRVMYDANCGTAAATAGTCSPFTDGDDGLLVDACDIADDTDPLYGQACTSSADCGGAACTAQTMGSLFTTTDFAHLSDCCNGKADAPDPCASIRTAGCTGIVQIYPTATQAQWVPVPVNP